MSSSIGFWDFSLRAYRQPGVADACLALQTQHGLDVNLLLYCCWIGASRGPLPESDLTAALEFSATWSANVVRPLREVRTWMKTTGCQSKRLPRSDCMEVRAAVKATELTAERLQQIGLEAVSEPTPVRLLTAGEQLEATVGNLTRYLMRMNLDRARISSGDLATVVTAAIPANSYDTVVLALTAAENPS